MFCSNGFILFLMSTKTVLNRIAWHWSIASAAQSKERELQNARVLPKRNGRNLPELGCPSSKLWLLLPCCPLGLVSHKQNERDESIDREEGKREKGKEKTESSGKNRDANGGILREESIA